MNRILPTALFSFPDQTRGSPRREAISDRLSELLAQARANGITDEEFLQLAREAIR